MADVSLADRAQARADDRISFYGVHHLALKLDVRGRVEHGVNEVADDGAAVHAAINLMRVSSDRHSSA